jgi:hypothetical protein
MSYYNAYRKRHYNLSSNQKKKYAQDMDELETYLEQSPYTYSSHLDSVYKELENCTIRLSNHKPTSDYHDLSDTVTRPVVDIRKSKKDFITFLENEMEHLITILSYLDLTYYRYIQVKPASKTLVCYLKGYKTKKIELFY